MCRLVCLDNLTVTTVRLTLGELWLSFEAHSVDPGVTILLPIDGMNGHGIYFDKLKIVWFIQHQKEMPLFKG